MDASIDIIEPRLELADPRVNRTSLNTLATETFRPAGRCLSRLGQNCPA